MTADWLVPWLSYASGMAILVCLFVLPLFAIFRRTRGFAGGGYVACSYVLGASLWAMCFLTVLAAWSLFWALVGSLMLGVGVLPMTLVIFAFDHQWALFAEIIGLGGLVIGIRMLGTWLIVKSG